MIRSGTCMMIGSLFLTLSLTTLASTPPAFDPRDPAIWEEKSDNPLAQSTRPAKCLPARYARAGKMINQISNVNVSGEQQRLQYRWRIFPAHNPSFIPLALRILSLRFHRLAICLSP
jgi:hypothetical protein